MSVLYRLDCAYVGHGFSGWQSQPDRHAVQDHLTKALATFLRHDVKLTGASRTDSGVHAEHQVATFRSSEEFDKERWLRSLTGLLPSGIGVHNIAPVAEDFHPIRSALGKVYRYSIWPLPSNNPFLEKFSWRVHGVSKDQLAQQGKVFVGTHDFQSFCATDSNAKTFTRTIYAVDVRCCGPLIEIWVSGEGFLKQMIRTMVGTMVDLALGRCNEGLPAILAAKDRRSAGQTAPAHGLTLVKVFYDQAPEVRHPYLQGLAPWA